MVWLLKGTWVVYGCSHEHLGDLLHRTTTVIHHLRSTEFDHGSCGGGPMRQVHRGVHLSALSGPAAK